MIILVKKRGYSDKWEMMQTDGRRRYLVFDGESLNVLLKENRCSHSTLEVADGRGRILFKQRGRKSLFGVRGR